MTAPVPRDLVAATGKTRHDPLMLADPDLPLRLAAFQAVKALTDRHGALVPWEAITEGFVHEGRRIFLATRARGIFRPKEMVGGALSVKTTVPRHGREARYQDLVEKHEGHLDYCFQGNDPDNRDNRLLEWCRANDVPIIYFYGIAEGLYAPMWPVYVGEMDRAALRARLLQGDPDMIRFDGTMVLNDPVNMLLQRRYRTVEAKARLHQAAFSALVLRAYDERCAICNLPKVRMLVEAAHIVPDRDVQGIPEVPNGLALCGLHHTAFDANLIGIRPDRVIQVSERLLHEHDGPVLEYGIKRFQGQVIRVPSRAVDRPGEEYLEERWERFRKAG